MLTPPLTSPQKTLSLDTQLLLDNLLTGVMVVDANLRVHRANHAAKQLLALNPKRLHQRELTLQDAELGLEMSLDLARIRHCIESEQSFTDSEVRLVNKEKTHWLEMSVTPLTHDLGLALIEIHLVDQQKQISQELQQRTQQQAARELVRGLAHEIKNPLGGLRGAAQLLERELTHVLDRADLTDFTQLIIAQADRLSKLVDRLLGPQQLTVLQSANIHSQLERVCQLISVTLPHNITLIRDYDPSIPNFKMHEEQIEQALLNILQNAVQALTEPADFPSHQAHKITLKTRIAHQVFLQGQRYSLAVEIRIIDTGPGILDTLRDTLFYPMVSGRVGGSGLGLSLAQDIVHQHQGRIEAHSRLGQTEFIIYLPLKR